MFIFYYGTMSTLTPPVALAAYAGAGIAGAPQVKTGFTAMRLALAAFVVPYLFVYSPAISSRAPGNRFSTMWRGVWSRFMPLPARVRVCFLCG